MGRKLKPLPANITAKPQRKLAEIEGRRTFIWNLLLAGADVRTIRAQVGEKFHVGNNTIEDDVRVLRAEATRHFEEERKDMTSMVIAKLDRIALELRQTAQEAGKNGERAIKVSALAAARQTEKDKAQIMGLIVNKQEVTGMIANIDVSQRAVADRLLSVKEALRNAGVTEDGAVLIESES